MLILKKTLQLNSLTPLKLNGSSFCAKIAANYQYFLVDVSAEDLLHLTSKEQEDGQAETGNQSFIIHLDHHDNRQQKVEMMNNWFHRVLQIGTIHFTYQDEVFITQVLYKLGITQAVEFMKQVQTLYQMHTVTNGLILKYSEQKEEFCKIIQRNSWENISDRKIIPRYFMQEKIFKHLATNELTHIVQEYHENRQCLTATMTRENILLAEHLKMVQMIQAAQVREETFLESYYSIRSFPNYYENFMIPQAYINEATIKKQIISAALLHLADMIYTNLHRSALANKWNSSETHVQISTSMYNSLTNMLVRFKEKHVQTWNMQEDYFNIGGKQYLESSSQFYLWEDHLMELFHNANQEESPFPQLTKEEIVKLILQTHNAEQRLEEYYTQLCTLTGMENVPPYLKQMEQDLKYPEILEQEAVGMYHEKISQLEKKQFLILKKIINKRLTLSEGDFEEEKSGDLRMEQIISYSDKSSEKDDPDMTLRSEPITVSENFLQDQIMVHENTMYERPTVNEATLFHQAVVDNTTLTDRVIGSKTTLADQANVDKIRLTDQANVDKIRLTDQTNVDKTRLTDQTNDNKISLINQIKGDKTSLTDQVKGDKTSLIDETTNQKNGDKTTLIDQEISDKTALIDHVIGNKTTFADQVTGDKTNLAGQVVVDKTVLIDQVISDEATLINQVIGKNTTLYDQAISNKPAFIDQVISDKTTLIDQVIRDKTTLYDQVISNKPAFIDQVISDKTTLIGQVISDGTTLINQAISDGTTFINQEIGNKTTLTKQANSGKTDLINQEIGNKTTLINRAISSKTDLINQEIGNKTTLTKQANSSKPTLINQEIGNKTTLIDQVINDATTLINQETVNKTTLINQSISNKTDLINQKTVNKTTLTKQAINDAATLINQKTGNKTTLIKQVINDAATLINQKTGNKATLIDQKISDEATLIDQIDQLMDYKTNFVYQTIGNATTLTDLVTGHANTLFDRTNSYKNILEKSESNEAHFIEDHSSNEGRVFHEQIAIQEQKVIHEPNTVHEPNAVQEPKVVQEDYLRQQKIVHETLWETDIKHLTEFENNLLENMQSLDHDQESLTIFEKNEQDVKLKQFLDQVNEKNVMMQKTMQEQMSSATKMQQVRVDKDASFKNSIRILEHPEEILTEMMVRHVTPTEKKILSNVTEHQMRCRQLELQAAIDQVYTLNQEDGKHPEDLVFIHKKNVIEREEVPTENLQKNKAIIEEQVKVIEENIKNYYEKNIDQQVNHTIMEELKIIPKLIEQNLKSQSASISELVYRKLERKLTEERKRRGY